jgi:hypothetical protein
MNHGLKTCSLWAFLAILIWAGQPVPAQSRTEGVVVLNLRSYGWEPPDRLDHSNPVIAVDHNGRVLVGFTVREHTGLVTRSQPSLGFRIVRFSPDGKMDLSLSLPTNAAGRTAIYLSDTDQIIARANDSLQLLQADEGNSQATVWKILAPCTARCYVTQSHSRHTLHLYTENADPPVTIVRLSQQPVLQSCGKAHQFIKSAEDSIQNFPQSITDDFAYFSSDGQPYLWPLCDYEHRVELPLRIHGRWMVLNEKLFVLDTYSSHTDDRGVDVISSDGQVRFRAKMAKHESADSLWEPIRASERGDRMAVHILTLRGGIRTLDIDSHITGRRIAVYDIEAGKEVASIPGSLKYHYRFAFALSPDGVRLAILEDDVVRVVDLDSLAKPEA